MRLLLDANLSPRLVVQFSEAGYDVAHVAELDLLNADDSLIFDYAVAEGYVIVTADSDFQSDARVAPRHLPIGHPAATSRRALSDDHVRLLLANLPSVTDDLERGVIVSLSPTRLAVRDLPIG